MAREEVKPGGFPGDDPTKTLDFQIRQIPILVKNARSFHTTHLENHFECISRRYPAKEYFKC